MLNSKPLAAASSSYDLVWPHTTDLKVCLWMCLVGNLFTVRHSLVSCRVWLEKDSLCEVKETINHQRGGAYATDSLSVQYSRTQTQHNKISRNHAKAFTTVTTSLTIRPTTMSCNRTAKSNKTDIFKIVTSRDKNFSHNSENCWILLRYFWTTLLLKLFTSHHPGGWNSLENPFWFIMILMSKTLLSLNLIEVRRIYCNKVVIIAWYTYKWPHP